MKVSSVSAGDGSSTSPTVKKLKQARLPFQIISSDSIKPTVTPPRKRKLSEEHEETPNKVGKTSLNSEVLQKKPIEQILISDDEVISENVDSSTEEPSTKLLNPLLSIVGVALKRKLRKKSEPAKKKQKKTNKAKNHRVSDANDGENVDSCSVKISVEEIINLDDDSNNISLSNDEKQNVNISAESLIENKENIDEEIKQQSSDEVETNEINNVHIEAEKKCNIDILREQSEDVKESNSVEKNDHDNTVDSEAIISSSSKLEQTNTDVSKLTPRRKRSCNSNKEFVTPRSKKESAELESSKDQTSSEKSTTSSPCTPTVDSVRKLTPKQIQKKLESAKKQQEREKEKLEKEKKKQEEKDEKNRQRLEKEEQKKKEKEEKEEQKKKEKEEKEELKKKEREEKERLKEQEKKEREEKEEAKRKEREEKDLQKKREREAKEEERKKKELEKEEDKRRKEVEKEELQSKKQKESAAFVNFFVPKDKASQDSDDQHFEDVMKNDYLSNFTKKSDMRLAPLVRRYLNDEKKSVLEEHITKQRTGKKGMYIAMLKHEDYNKGRSKKTWPLEEIDNDVMIVEDELPMDSLDNIVTEESHKQILRPKMLSFSENRRPPYWGTWRRKSILITGRKPFGIDSTLLDYDCDSDEEWEEEEPGESVGGSVAGSDDEEGENDYDVDNEFMVPHGYLSEEEAMGEEDEQILSPEIQKAKLKILQCEFENEMKKNTERLHPRLLGILWQKSDGGKPDSYSDTVWNFLSNKKILCGEEHIFIQPTPINNDCEAEDSEKLKKSRKIEEKMIPDLIKLIHGNTNSRGFLAHEFQTFIAKNLTSDGNRAPEIENQPTPVSVSKMSIAKKIKEISKWMTCPEEGAMQGKMCWFVCKEVRDQFSVDMELPNQWSYALTPKRKLEKAKKEVCKTPNQPKVNPELVKSAMKEPASDKKETSTNITKFTKKMTQEEREKQFVNPSAITEGSTKEGEKVPEKPQVAPPTKKRVALLFSGPINKPLPSSQKETPKSSEKESVPKLQESEEVIEINDDKSSSIAQKNVSDKKKSQVNKKRVSFVSKGSETPKTIKTNLLTQFIKTVSNEKKTDKKNSHIAIPMETDDCVVLSD